MSEATVFCNQCGQAVNAAASFCTRCGATLVPAAATPSIPIPSQLSYAARYGGFWIRFLAALIDGILVFAALTPVRMALHIPMGVIAGRHPDGFNPLMMMPMVGLSGIISIVANWLYETFLLSSDRQATLGKMALGLKVTDLHGRRLSFGHASGRHFAKWISNLTLLVGYIIAGFTERKQALHDLIAGTLVVKS